MKIEVNEHGTLVLKEIYTDVLLETDEGNALRVCMRDDTLEISVRPKHGRHRWYRANMQEGTIEPLG